MSYESGCEKKVVFVSTQEARRAAKKMKQTHKTDVISYKCRYCKYWHVGGRKKKGKDDYISNSR